MCLKVLYILLRICGRAGSVGFQQDRFIQERTGVCVLQRETAQTCSPRREEKEGVLGQEEEERSAGRTNTLSFPIYSHPMCLFGGLGWTAFPNRDSVIGRWCDWHLSAGASAVHGVARGEWGKSLDFESQLVLCLVCPTFLRYGCVEPFGHFSLMHDLLFTCVQMKRYQSSFGLFQIKGVVAYLFLSYYFMLWSAIIVYGLLYVTTAAIWAVLNAHYVYYNYENIKNVYFIIANVFLIHI